MCHRRFNVSHRSNAGMSFHQRSPRQNRCSISGIARRESPAPLCHGFERPSRHLVSTFRATATASRDQSPRQEPVAFAQIWHPLPNPVRRHHGCASSAIPDKPTTSDWVRTAQFRLYQPAISTSPTDCAPCPARASHRSHPARIGAVAVDTRQSVCARTRGTRLAGSADIGSPPPALLLPDRSAHPLQ